MQMIGPEAFAEYSPEQEELRLLYSGIQRALETNARLHVDTEIIETDGNMRVFRTAWFGYLDVATVMPDSEFAEMAVQSRTNLNDKNDMDFVVIDFRHHEASDAQTGLMFKVTENPSVGPVDQRAHVYELAKFLPLLEDDPQKDLDDDQLDDDEFDAFEDDFDDFIDEQASAIRPDDMEVLQRVLRLVVD